MTIGLVGISCAIFGFIRYFAKGSPSTMTQEYQEATNEYLRVCATLHCLHDATNTRIRDKTSSQSLVFLPKDTSARVWFNLDQDRRLRNNLELLCSTVITPFRITLANRISSVYMYNSLAIETAFDIWCSQLCSV